jgi:uroporphyrinogen-III synthase
VNPRLHILITRPERQSMRLLELLAQAACDVLHLPTIAFAPPSDAHAFSVSLQKVRDQDVLIFVSPEAVYRSAASFTEICPSWMTQITCAAIGRGTARALQDVGVLNVIYPNEHPSGQSLANLAIFQAINHKKVMLVCGESGLSELATILNDRGALISYCYAYRRILPVIEMAPYFEAMKKRPVDVMIATSGDSVKNLKILFGDNGSPIICNIPLIVVSARVHNIAESIGFTSIYTSDDASPESILKMIMQLRKENKDDRSA